MAELPLSGASASARSCAVVTPADSGTGFYAARALYVGTGGDVVVVDLNGSAVTFKSVPSGMILPVQCMRVNSTNTTASNIVALL